MTLLFTGIIALWILSEVYIGRCLRSNNTDQQGLDKKTLRYIWFTILISIFAGVFISKSLSLPVYTSINGLYTAYALILIGCIFRFYAIYSLGRHFTADVTIREGHELKKDGLYKYFRHPSYTASLLSFLGYSLTLNNYLSLIVIIIPVFLVFKKRISIEEQALAQHFGTEYESYRKSTFKLVPFY